MLSMNDGLKKEDTTVEKKPFAVKIFTTATEYDYQQPWSAPSVTKWTGSGFAVDGNRIITNAHVAGGAAFIEVQLANDATKYKARVKAVGHDCDLAILEVDDPAFWKKAGIINIADTPLQSSKVEVHGFPTGGGAYCITEGTVSRTENHYYAHSEEKLLCTQVSAPINPGNSGGAVINKQGEVVGVAHQGMRGGQNIGYMIPAGVLKQFLRQVDSNNIGFPDLAISVQRLENEYLRRRFKMREEQSGVSVTDIHLLSNAFLRLKEKDVLMAINGHQIFNDGTVNLPKIGRVDWRYVVNHSEMGDNVTFNILRDGKECQERFALANTFRSTRVIGGLEFGKPPTYLLIAGLICAQPVNKNYIYDNGQIFPNRQKKFKDEQLIAINTILTSEYTQGYDGLKGDVIERVNGINIHNMQDLIDAVDNNKEANHRIELHSGNEIVVPNLPKPEMQSVMRQYGIEHDRSVDLVKAKAETDPLQQLITGRKQPVLFASPSSVPARAKTPSLEQNEVLDLHSLLPNESEHKTPVVKH